MNFMKRSSALGFAYTILTDKRNENKYIMTQARNKETLEIEATYQDAVKVIKDAYSIETTRPEIICLCGSTRFFKTFDEQNFKLTLAGKIVLSVGCNTKSDEGLKLTTDDKVRLDELHKRKIDMCDNVLVLNVGGYIGRGAGRSAYAALCSAYGGGCVFPRLPHRGR
jgi:hypothetical protein